MFLSQFRLAMIVGVALAATTGSALADQGKGFRWSDHAWGNSSKAQSTPATTTVVAASPSVAANTVAVRGPDGVVRNYPVEGGVVVQRETGLAGQTSRTVTVRDADGVMRSYPVVSEGTVAPASNRGIFGGLFRRGR
jgi:hypothetical protein